MGEGRTLLRLSRPRRASGPGGEDALPRQASGRLARPVSRTVPASCRFSPSDGRAGPRSEFGKRHYDDSGKRSTRKTLSLTLLHVPGWLSRRRGGTAEGAGRTPWVAGRSPMAVSAPSCSAGCPRSTGQPRVPKGAGASQAGKQRDVGGPCEVTGWDGFVAHTWKNRSDL